MSLSFSELKDFLDSKAEKYNNPSFIENDPISIPHQFSQKKDKEISAFLAATIAWGQRSTIIKNANKLVRLMDFEPYEFITNANQHDFKLFRKFTHRTFNGIDCKYFLKSLKNIYLNHGGLESVFNEGFAKDQNIKTSILHFRKIFFEQKHPLRTEKHIANPAKKSSAKRINMFLRWMVRQDNSGVDFGLWKQIPAKSLYCPLDIHSGNVARSLNLLKNKQNNWSAVEELTENLRKFDAKDPIKYDFALFGLGVNEKFC